MGPPAVPVFGPSWNNFAKAPSEGYTECRDDVGALAVPSSDHLGIISQKPHLRGILNVGMMWGL